VSSPLVVWIDQDLCTGDGLCVQLAPAVFEFDVDGLAYVKDSSGTLLEAPGASVPVPARCVADVLESARGCPGDCIFVADSSGTPIAGPGAA
jgi:ferredoxin